LSTVTYEQKSLIEAIQISTDTSSKQNWINYRNEPEVSAPLAQHFSWRPCTRSLWFYRRHNTASAQLSRPQQRPPAAAAKHIIRQSMYYLW